MNAPLLSSPSPFFYNSQIRFLPCWDLASALSFDLVLGKIPSGVPCAV